MNPLKSPASNVRTWNAYYYVKPGIVIICGYLIIVHLWLWVLTYPLSIGGRADFRQLYTAGYIVRNGYRHQLYDPNLQTRFENLVVGPSDTPLPFNHLAYESLIFVPLSVFSYRTAYLFFLLINGVLLDCRRADPRPGFNYSPHASGHLVFLASIGARLWRWRINRSCSIQVSNRHSDCFTVRRLAALELFPRICHISRRGTGSLDATGGDTANEFLRSRAPRN